MHITSLLNPAIWLDVVLRPSVSGLPRHHLKPYSHLFLVLPNGESKDVLLLNFCIHYFFLSNQSHAQPVLAHFFTIIGGFHITRSVSFCIAQFLNHLRYQVFFWQLCMLRILASVTSWFLVLAHSTTYLVVGSNFRLSCRRMSICILFMTKLLISNRKMFTVL